MTNEIISYLEMCRREGLSLQAGMNFCVGGTHSVILMSVRPNAPYRDRIDGMTLIYEGHNQPRVAGLQDPKLVDQLDALPSGEAKTHSRRSNGKPLTLERRVKRIRVSRIVLGPDRREGDAARCS